MRRAWRDQIAVCTERGSRGPGGRRRSTGRMTACEAVVVAASIAPLAVTVHRGRKPSCEIRPYLTETRHGPIAPNRIVCRPVLAPPRLPPRIEHRILRFVCGLPGGLQRAAFGAPPQIDGQRLATEIQPLLRLASLARDESASAYGKLSPQQARARIRASSAAAAGPKRSLPAVGDLAIPAPAGTIPARYYEPPGVGLENRPLIVYFHGGGWTIGDLDTCDSICRFLAANTPAAVLSVAYRLAPPPPLPAAVEDPPPPHPLGAAGHLPPGG